MRSADTNDAGHKWQILPSGRHHDKASYLAAWFFFTGKRSAVEAKLGPARHIDGKCRDYTTDSACYRTYRGSMPASDGWVFAEGVRHALAVAHSSPAKPAPKRRKTGAADTEEPQTWMVYTEVLRGESWDIKGESSGDEVGGGDDFAEFETGV